VRRRAFITLLGAVAWPLLAARAQQPAMPVIGFVESSDILKQATAAFLKSLNETGYVDHHNVVIEYRRAEGHNDRLPALISDLLRRKATVIVTNGPAALAACRTALPHPRAPPVASWRQLARGLG
jgi:putative ABC transport system substrate-binding protein